VQELSANLKAIFDDVGKGYSDEAITLIATAGEGSVRDSLSIADMCLAFSEGDVTYNDVLEVLGASDPNVIIGLCDAIMRRDTESVLNIVNNIAGYGKNIAMLAKDIARYVRDILYIKYCTNSPSMLKLPTDIFNKLKVIADSADAKRLLYVVEMFNGMNTELRYSTQPRILLEAALIRATTDPVETELLQRVKALEAKLARVSEGGPALQEKKSSDAAEVRSVDVVSLWARCRLELVNKDKFYALGVPMNNYKTVELSAGNALKVTYAKRSDAVLLSDKDNLRVIEEKLAALSGKAYRVQIVSLEAEKSETTVERLKSVFGDNLKITK
jgi:DNA polymerase III, gamma/tau subunits